jgi:hypothetical protein
VRRRFLQCMAAALLCTASAGALAHRFQMGIAEVTENASTGSVEVVHTYMAHDIDALVALIAKRQVDLSQPADEALLRTYVDQHFYLLGPDGQRLPLKWVGMQASVDSIVIFQELEKTPLTQVARIHNGVLADFLPRQSNTVNVTVDGALRSLFFDAKVTERQLK